MPQSDNVTTSEVIVENAKRTLPQNLRENFVNFEQSQKKVRGKKKNLFFIFNIHKN